MYNNLTELIKGNNKLKYLSFKQLCKIKREENVLDVKINNKPAIAVFERGKIKLESGIDLSKIKLNNKYFQTGRVDWKKIKKIYTGNEYAELKYFALLIDTQGFYHKIDKSKLNFKEKEKLKEIIEIIFSADKSVYFSKDFRKLSASDIKKIVEQL